MKILYKYTKKIITLSVILSTALFLSGCATTVTKSIDVDPHELKHERDVQLEMARNMKGKEMLAPLKSDSIYQQQISRVSQRLTRSLQPLCGNANCNYPTSITKGDDINAFADGTTVKIYRGMMRFVQNDDELAVVISHEMAHNLHSHSAKTMQNAGLGMIFDIAAAFGGVDTQGTFTDIAQRSYSPQFENEADYVGLYIMARAGFNINVAPNFWRRMGAYHPAGINNQFMGTHPSTPERFIKLKKTIGEINHKKAHKEPLVPEYQNSKKK